MSKPNNTLEHLPVILFDYSTSLEGCLDLLSLQESKGEMCSIYSDSLLSSVMLTPPLGKNQEVGKKIKRKRVDRIFHKDHPKT